MNSTANREFSAIEPLEIEQWLKPLKKEEQLQNPTLEKVPRVMSLTFQYGQRYGFVPRDDSGNPMNGVRQPTTRDYRAIIMTPKQRLLARTTSGFNSISHYRHAGQIRLNAAASAGSADQTHSLESSVLVRRGRGADGRPRMQQAACKKHLTKTASDHR